MATSDKPKTSVPAPSPAAAAVANERINFKTLLLGNPNHFGTLPNFGGKVVFPKQFDTAFEQITCLGLNPAQNKLEAVFNIKQRSGYGTDACGTGSKEYVRFFVQHGAVWQDLGHAVVDVYDLASTPLPLSYSVSVNFNEARKFCTTENILNVRAILSWNLDPTPGDPNFIPPWGNVINARVQVAPRTFFHAPISTLLSEGILKIDPAVIGEIDITKNLPAKVGPPPPQPFSVLKSLYANHPDVPSHRFGFAEAQQILAKPVLESLPPPAPGVLTPNALTLSPNLTAGPELAAILANLSKVSGDTTFEQLLCAGYNPQTRELEAVVQINRNAGYSGGLCSPGSTEYVSFFAFFNGAWQSLGTTSVQVHDLAAVTPGNPVTYAVYRLSNMTTMPCATLTGIPFRAILSWQQQPTGPNFVPVWGDIVNTNIQPQKDDGTGGEHSRLMRIGGVTIDRISDTSHLAYPRNIFDPAHGLPVIAGDCGGDDSPFGGELIVEGDFIPKPDVFNHLTGLVIPGLKPIIYQTWYTRTDVPSVPAQMIKEMSMNQLTPRTKQPHPANRLRKRSWSGNSSRSRQAGITNRS